MSGACVVVQNPTKINMIHGKLVCEDEASVEYKGDYKLYSHMGKVYGSLIELKIDQKYKGVV